ncbi:tetratricopeptide repeat protein 12-like isoform X2 [Watersipora subatra]|uniref:tetratricopeptide repeat protein 12-like isoform X2 n=1 Tax=Watersipora subatra TaxID=2589382 RepID=UPI00355B54A5
MDFDNKEKLEGFLGNVDKISELIKNLNSENESERDKAMADADGFLQSSSVKALKKPAPDRTGVNRTVINRASPNDTVTTDQEAFMKAMEKDVEERTERKRKAKGEASVYKNKGNEAFKAEDYEKAVQLYSKGLDILKDFKELWTNRAQAYIKLARYEEARSDCDWAQRCDPNYIKAYVLEAKALLGLGDYDKAISVYEQAMEIDKNKESMLREFISEVELKRNSVEQERSAKELFDSGAQHPATLVDVLNKVNAVGELPLYYDGGVRVLADLLADDKCQTLFRTEGGLEMYQKHPFFSRVMLNSTLQSLSKEELDACSGMFFLLTSAANNNVESQRQLVSHELFPKLVMRFLDINSLRKKRDLRLSCLALLLALSEAGRKYISAQFDIKELLRCLFQLVSCGGTIAIRSLNIVSNLTLDPKFRRTLYDSLDTVLPSFEAFLDSDKHGEVVPACLTIMTNLCTDSTLRRAMAERPSMSKYPASCVEQRPAYHSAVHSVLGFLMNITLDKTEAVIAASFDLVRGVLPYLNKQTDIQERVVGLLSHILPLSTTAVDHFLSNEQWLDTLIGLLASSSYLQHTVKSLTACTRHSLQVCKRLADSPAAVQSLIQSLESDNEALLGNACLCLGHCALEKSVNEGLGEENMKRLLVIIREAKGSAVKQNAAILVGRLVKANSRHLEALRRLDGLGILHNSTKYYKL